MMKIFTRLLSTLILVSILIGAQGHSCGYGEGVVDSSTIDENLSAPAFTISPGNKKITISYTEVAEAVSYNIHVSKTASKIADTPVLTKITENPVEVDNLDNNVVYYVVVQSVGSDGLFSPIPSDKEETTPNSEFVQMANGDVTTTDEQKDTIKALKELVGFDTSLANKEDNYNAYLALEDLTEISLVDKNLKDIVALKSLTNLITLNLSSNEIEDLSPLSEMESLQKLTLQKNRFSDLSVVLSLKKLVELDVSFNDGINFDSVAIDLSTLTSTSEQEDLLPDFKKFTAVDCELTDLTGIAWLEDLEELYLSGNGVLTLDPIVNFQKLLKVDLSGNPSELKSDTSYQTLKDRVNAAEGGEFTGLN